MDGIRTRSVEGPVDGAPENASVLAASRGITTLDQVGTPAMTRINMVANQSVALVNLQAGSGQLVF